MPNKLNTRLTRQRANSGCASTLIALMRPIFKQRISGETYTVTPFGDAGAFDVAFSGVTYRITAMPMPANLSETGE